MPAPARERSLKAVAIALFGLLALSPGVGAESVQDTGDALGRDVSEAAAVWTGEHAYVFGGATDSGMELQTDRVWQYTPATGEVDQLDAKLPSNRSQMAAVWTGEAAYLFGGYGCEDASATSSLLACNDVLKFSPSEQAEITDTGIDLPTGGPISGFWTGSEAYLFPDNSAEILRYEPGSQSVEVLDASLDGDRPGASAAWADGLGYVIGGGETDTILEFDPDQGTVETLEPRLPSPRNDTAALWMGDRVYVFGGEGSSMDPLPSVLSFNPVTDTVENRSVALEDGRSRMPVVGNNTDGFLLGGLTSEGRTDDITRYVPGNSPPEADFTLDTGTRSVTVTAETPLDPDGDVEEVRWDFGDGNQTTGEGPVEHAYEYAGTYEIQMTVTDEHGETSTATRSVTFYNEAPSAGFDLQVDRGTINVDASASDDPDGEIRNYHWDWGDGTTDDTGAQASHAYHDSERFTVQLTVTDQDGATAQASDTVQIDSYEPDAVLDVTVDGWTVHANASDSVDPGGRIVDQRIDWDDGNTSDETVANHTYTSTGQRVVELTVEDDDGNTASVTRTVEIENQPPVLEVETNLNATTVRLDATESHDVNGRIASVEWTFPDGTTQQGPTTQHTFEDSGTQEIEVSATDEEGLSASTNLTVEIEPQDPLAAMDLTLQGQRLTADANPSTDPDGVIEAYAWSFDDGDEATGLEASHHYDGPGTYEVRLEVRDDDGRTATATRQLEIDEENRAPRSSPTLEVDGLTVRASAGDSTDPDGSIDTYHWDLGDGTTENATHVNHTFAEPGSYKVGLKVVDDAGQASWAYEIVTVPTDEGADDPPLTMDVEVDAQTIEAEADGISPDRVEAYTWSLGDGATASGGSLRHTYAQAGDYQLELTAETPNGAVTVSRTVSIQPADPVEGAEFDPGSRSQGEDFDRDDVSAEGATLDQPGEDDRNESPLGMGAVLAGLAGALWAGASSRD